MVSRTLYAHGVHITYLFVSCTLYSCHCHFHCFILASLVSYIVRPYSSCPFDGFQLMMELSPEHCDQTVIRSLIERLISVLSESEHDDSDIPVSTNEMLYQFPQVDTHIPYNSCSRDRSRSGAGTRTPVRPPNLAWASPAPPPKHRPATGMAASPQLAGLPTTKSSRRRSSAPSRTTRYRERTSP